MLRKFLYTVSAASKAIQISRQGKGIILLATIPDIESLLAGAMVKMIVGSRLTFILEVRDPFSLNKALPWGPVKRWIGRTLEGFLLRWPDRAVFLTPEIERMYLNSFESKGAWLQNHRVITNGFDPAEYAPHSR
jgi:hypothetical protein